MTLISISKNYTNTELKYVSCTSNNLISNIIKLKLKYYKNFNTIFL